MKKYHFKTAYQKMLADTVTPVSLYLKLRDRFAGSILLESSDYHGNENSLSYLCCEPIASFEASQGAYTAVYPDGTQQKGVMPWGKAGVEPLIAFAASFESTSPAKHIVSNGLFGYLSFDAVQHFEDLRFRSDKPKTGDIPEIRYQVYKYVIAIDHFRNELHLFAHTLEGSSEESGIEEVATLLRNKNYPSYHFQKEGNERSNFTDEGFLEVIEKGKQHCFLGDVFQIVLSRRFEQQFTGDEFNVYRALRSINPSPYLFYFDYGNFKLFGSSPEAQIMIKGRKATIFPIAGTFRRTGNDAEDAALAQKLYDDPKENAEHVMLVDLARNDLSRNGADVRVETYKEIQYYSHLIHLVSKVSGTLSEGVSPLRVVADTFPAGTLSGAPKYKALQLIDRYEPTPRNYYGGAIGFLGFNGDFNHCIAIRSFLSQHNVLHYQAGAGIVAKSEPHSELQEVSNKLAALRQALQDAEHLLS